MVSFSQREYDVGTQIDDNPSKHLDNCLKNLWNFRPYLYHLDKSIDFEPLKSMEGVETYFD